MQKTALILLNGALVAMLTSRASTTLDLYEPFACTSVFAARAKAWKLLGR
jgi:hypothetical protein